MKPFVFTLRFAPELIAAAIGITLAYVHRDLDWVWLSAYALIAFHFVTRWIPPRIAAQWRRVKVRSRGRMLRS